MLRPGAEDILGQIASVLFHRAIHDDHAIFRHGVIAVAEDLILAVGHVPVAIHVHCVHCNYLSPASQKLVRPF